MNPLLTATQERARESIVGCFPEHFSQSAQAVADLVDVLLVATWNEAIGAAEGVVPEEKEEVVRSYYEGTNVVDPDTSVLLKEAVGHNACRTETLQALSKLKI